MAMQCDPCLCPDQHINHLITWRKAVVTLLCRIANGIGGAQPIPAGNNHIGSVNVDNTVTVQGTVSVNEPVTVDGTVIVSSITNPVTVNGTVSVTQPVTVNGTVGVSSITNPVTVSSITNPVTVTGAVTATVSGTVTQGVAAATSVVEVSSLFSALNDSTYTQILANANALKVITISNSMDVPVSISFDGSNPHHTLLSGTSIVLDLASNGLTKVGNVYAKRKAAGASKGEVAVGGMY